MLAGRVNMTTRRLRLRLARRGRARRTRWSARIERLGYRLVPFDAAALAAAQDSTGRALIRALAVAGFAAGNVMLLSIGIWAGELGGLLHDMGPATRDLLHWVSALIAMPAIAYAGRPFFASALRGAAAAAHQHGRADQRRRAAGHRHEPGADHAAAARTPISIPPITLLFFLLIGRVLDHRARGQARATAEQLLTLRAADVAVLQPDGSVQRRAPARGRGGRPRAGRHSASASASMAWWSAARRMLDASLVTGESLPVAAAPGTRGVRRHAEPRRRADGARDRHRRRRRCSPNACG